MIDLSEHLKKFEKMNKCLSKALNSEIPINYNEKFHSTTVFTPSLIEDMRGGNNVDVCAIESFDVPSYSTQEEAIESLDALTVPDEDREKAWKFQDMYVDYINMHSKADAAKLGGQYGLAEDVEVLLQVERQFLLYLLAKILKINRKIHGDLRKQGRLFMKQHRSAANKASTYGLISSAILLCVRTPLLGEY